MDIKKNDEIRLEITSLTNQGSGLGRYKDQVVFVDSSAVGDILDVHIIKVKGNYAIGKIKKIIKPSSDRISVDCEVFNSCGGCAYRHLSYESELREKKQYVKDALLRIGTVDAEIEDILHIENPDRYRNKAQIPIGLSSDGRIITGFYSRKSHRIVSCDDCLLQMEEFPKIIAAIKKYIAERPVTIYDESTHRGLFRHIYLRRGINTGEVMVCLVLNGDNLPKKDRLIELLLEADENIKSVVISVNKEKTNVVLGEKLKTIYGRDYIEDILCSLRFKISPLSFFQVNPKGTELLYKKAQEYASLSEGEVLLDLYCGTGTIGLTMAGKAKKIYGVEVIPEAIENAKENARLNNIQNAEFICGDAFEASKLLSERGINPDAAIIDPPRKGASREVIELLCKMNPKRIVYVSCDPGTLARDCKIFKELGYEVRKVCCVDMFPRTVHVETVVQLVKRNFAEENYYKNRTSAQILEDNYDGEWQ